jgi:hypothetical protein
MIREFDAESSSHQTASSAKQSCLRDPPRNLSHYLSRNTEALVDRVELEEKKDRFFATLAARLPDHKTTIGEYFTDAQFLAIAAECGLSEEDLDQLQCLQDLKFKLTGARN